MTDAAAGFHRGARQRGNVAARGTRAAGRAGARATAATRADELTAQISDLRDRLNGRVQRADDDPVKLRIEIDRLLAEEKTLQRQRPIDLGIIESCKAWLAALPPATVLEQVEPVVEDGLSLTAVRARIKKLQESVAALKRVPIPAPDISQKVQSYVRGQTRPVIGGIGAGEALSVQRPTNLHALMAFLQPQVLIERLLAEIDQIANTPCPLAEREQRIVDLEEEIDRLQRTEETLVVTTGAPRERGCPPWVVLSVKPVDARGVRAA
jgi:hypothetical protein